MTWAMNYWLNVPAADIPAIKDLSVQMIMATRIDDGH